ncbi:SAM-dependent methyltransferase [Paraburkholderia phymatum]|uniref:Methyltransferase type 12 n=1 Tax=Paraburkholderia phymatum (strain DSM 17167 / CIP 108236 / LMG 21445 / STM815) TaxID=391038 RepID=B2JNJ2_PARP8|nr:SAM-dependent methyltransferase [Paraburkholderia phymatum]ACC74494.1 Methyltransferase type 12 [Paraburkholderia phymatum STM815]
MSFPPAYFDDMYRQDDDPWDYRGSWYERRKRLLTVAALPRARYRSGFEPACSNGELSALLAQRCDRLYVCDISDQAIHLARERLADVRNVTFAQRAIPEQWPDASFDLIVIGELCYYLSRDATAELAQRACASLTADGTLVACHWRHPFEGKLQTAEDVHAAFDALPAWRRIVQHAEHDLLLDVWSKDGQSVAQREGLA